MCLESWDSEQGNPFGTMFIFLINSIRNTLRANSLSPRAECMGLWTGFADMQNLFVLPSSSSHVRGLSWRLTSGSHAAFWGTEWMCQSTKGSHDPRHAHSSSVQTDGSCLPISMNASVNSPHFLGQNDQDWNIFHWWLGGTEHPISLTFPVRRKWWEINLHIKMSAFLRMKTTTATLAETSDWTI